MKHEWILVTNSFTKRKFYYNEKSKVIVHYNSYPSKKYNYETKYFNTLNKKDLSEDIIRKLTKVKSTITYI